MNENRPVFGGCLLSTTTALFCLSRRSLCSSFLGSETRLARCCPLTMHQLTNNSSISPAFPLKTRRSVNHTLIRTVYSTVSASLALISETWCCVENSTSQPDSNSAFAFPTIALTAALAKTALEDATTTSSIGSRIIYNYIFNIIKIYKYILFNII